MTGSLNRTILTGRLAADPDLRYTGNEIPIVHFPLAVGRIPKSGEKEAEVDFIKCIAWRGLAKICSEYLKKGRLVAVEGKLQMRKYEVNGKKRSEAEVVVDNMQMLDNKFYKAAEKAAPDKKDELIPAVLEE